MQRDYMLLAGERLPVATNDDLVFPRGSTRTRKAKVSRIVLHWDVCRSSRACHRALLSRMLSVHLMVDADGTIYQACDLERYQTWHAGNDNPYSIGIEVCNPVTPALDAKRKHVMIEHPHSHVQVEVCDFWPAQKAAVVAICDAVAAHYGWTRQYCGTYGVLSQEAREAFIGVIGHYHVTRSKWDPASLLWPALEGAGWVARNT